VGFGFTGGGGAWRRCMFISPDEFLATTGELLECNGDTVLRGFGWGDSVDEGMVTLWWGGDPLKNSNKKGCNLEGEILFWLILPIEN